MNDTDKLQDSSQLQYSNTQQGLAATSPQTPMITSKSNTAEGVKVLGISDLFVVLFLINIFINPLFAGLLWLFGWLLILPILIWQVWMIVKVVKRIRVLHGSNRPHVGLLRAANIAMGVLCLFVVVSLLVWLF